MYAAPMKVAFRGLSHTASRWADMPPTTSAFCQAFVQGSRSVHGAWGWSEAGCRWVDIWVLVQFSRVFIILERIFNILGGVQKSAQLMSAIMVPPIPNPANTSDTSIMPQHDVGSYSALCIT